MTDRPIIFSAPMVRALLYGRKTQTRRALKPPYGTLEYLGGETWRPICTKFFPGDRLWVREAHVLTPAGVAYVADGADHYGAGGPLRKRPSIHMPRWASRLTLHVTEVRVQRLHEISAEDVAAEGACELAFMPPSEADTAEARAVFRSLWNSLHGPDAWDANPWVCAISFKVERANIDAAKETTDD